MSESVNLRERPGTDSKVLKLVPMGYEVEIREKYGEWTKVVFEGTVGYVKNEYIEVTRSKAGGSAAKGASPAGGSANKSGGEGSAAKNAAESGALRYGDEGDAVKELQRLLSEKGIYEGPINGKFGPMTEEAVFRYQEAAGIERDGVVGSETMKKLKERPHPAGTYRNGDTGDEVKTIQKSLKEKNYYKGPINGKFGPLTEEAVIRFQTANNLEVDGIVGKITLELIKTPPKAAAKSASGTNAKSAAPANAKKIESQVAPNGVELMNWSDVKDILEIGMTVHVYDVKTGIKYNVKSFSNGKHADVEPVTPEDTENLKLAYGGTWSWDPHPVWVTFGGRTIAASINGMPHGGGVISENGMNGQICLHFYGGSTHNGNARYSRQLQDAVLEAWDAARR